MTWLRTKLSKEDIDYLLDFLKGSQQFASSPGPYLATPIDELAISTRAKNALRTDNINTVAELIKITEAEFLRIPNLGKITLKEVKQVLAEMGLRLGDII